MDKKVLIIEDMKTESENGKTYITGYANTKDKEDRYGDIPKGDNIYDIKMYKKNPIVFVDHQNSAGMIAGNMVSIKEDEKGLAFKLLLRNMEDVHNPIVKDAISAYKTGFGSALSIGGQWTYGDKNNPKVLTKAVIHEISIVGVGADGFALTDIPKPKSFQDDKIFEGLDLEKINPLIKKYGKEKITEIIKCIKEIKNENIKG